MPGWSEVLLFVAGLVLFLAAAFLLTLVLLEWHRRSLRRYFADRPTLDDDGFHRQVGPGGDVPPHVAATVRRIVGSFLKLPHEKLEPDMNLEELVPWWSRTAASSPARTRPVPLRSARP